ncbi:glycosyltransferase [Leclercia sp. EC_58]|uniref:glycosyltransferase n=1 Tax=Leclercia sp. EC_58 TaxID=2584090 RepID=UPI001C703134|nr:glycosyltransferase [Leclercia sp. EC_58]MBW9399808.1 glycosyltransferase [Leclercia sp. EC_58]
MFDPINYKHIVSIDPINDSHIYHYHRPNKCNEVRKNSLCTIHFDLLDLRQHDDINTTLERLDCFNHLVFINKNEYLRWEFKHAEKHLINHGYDASLLLRKQKYPHNKSNIAIFSKNYQDGRKGNVYLRKLIDKMPSEKVHFFLIGRDWEHSSLNSFNNVTILNPKNYKSLVRIYSIIDVVLICSPYEGGPASLPEAISAGCRVISSNCGMVNEFIYEKDMLSFDLEKDINLILSHISHINGDIKQSFRKKPQLWEEIASSYHHIYGMIL